MSIPTARYLRQSQALNDDEAAVQRQDTATAQVVADRGLEVVETYVDNDYSATKGKPRPAYLRMIEDWRRGRFRAIVAYDLDRLYRLPRELEDLIDLAEKEGLLLFTASGDADLSTDGGRLFARIKAAVAKGEVERKSARQRLRNEQDAAAGHPYWRRRPFGYELDGTLRQEEAVAIRKAYEMIVAGQRQVDVQKLWNGLGLRTPEYARVGGNEWTLVSVRQILKSPRNAAIRVYKGEELPGSWEPIVDEALWRTAQDVMKNASAGRGYGRGVANLLSGIAVCSRCGRKVRSMRRMNGAKVYVCDTRHLARAGDACDAQAEEYVVTRLSRPDAAELLVDGKRPDSTRLKAERDGIRQRLEALAHDHYVEGIVPRSTFVDMTKALQRRLGELEGQMVHQERAEVLGGLLGAEDVRAVWDELGLNQRRAVLGVLLERVTVLPGRGVPLELVPREDG